MGTITTKHLKQKTGEVVRRVRSGEELSLTGGSLWL
jgi:antitoxin (DNA-binding transcriptional repressor) of toxin-antitoxin stability system